VNNESGIVFGAGQRHFAIRRGYENGPRYALVGSEKNKALFSLDHFENIGGSLLTAFSDAHNDFFPKVHSPKQG
jgi:hypothetical protein